MQRLYQKTSACLLACLFLVQMAAVAAAPKAQLSNVRFSKQAAFVRIVFDLSAVPKYTVATSDGGTKILLDFPETENRSKLKALAIQDPLIKSVQFSTVNKTTLRASIELTRNAVYKVQQLKNPNRVFIDLIKNYDQKLVDPVAPGLNHITLLRGNENGMLTVHALDVDLQKGYKLVPALAGGVIAGREKLSGIASRSGALAAVNASYFELSGEILGLTKIDGTIVSTTYLKRSAFGIGADGKALIGQVAYDGKVKLPDGKSLPVSGVNCERGENALILYNSHYGASTRTNLYGREYVVKGGKVAAVSAGNAPLAPGSVVVSAHGAAMQALAGLKVGDALEILEETGAEWNTARQILGVGPMLVKDKSVYLTTKAEQFGGDVAGGRAPRTAVGVTADGRVLLVVADGRQSHSIGCTLLELALLMQELGATDAVNFDGGGSSEMILRGEIVNSPSDGGERSVGSALLLLEK